MPTPIHALLFYGVGSACGVIGWPLVAPFLPTREHPAVAHLAARLVGLLALAYAAWLGPALALLPAPASLAAACVIGTLLGIRGSRDRWRSATPAARRRIRRGVIGIEAAGLAIYLGYLFVRSHNVAIYGTERMMDMALLSAAARAEAFPFPDPWFSAGQVDFYYYYGSYLVSVLASVSRTPLPLAYTFALGWLFTITTLLAGGIVYSSTRRLGPALAAAFLVSSGGSALFATCAAGAWAAGLPDACDFTRASHPIDPSFVIREIPSYSFTVGDLHAHVLGLPIFLLLILVLCWRSRRRGEALGRTLLLALLLASAAMTNSWDAITIGLLIGVVGLTRLASLRRWGAGWAGALRLSAPWLIGMATAAAVAVVAALPFLWHFHTPVAGIGFSPYYVRIRHLAGVGYPSPAREMIGLWGPFAGLLGVASITLRRQSAARLPGAIATTGFLLIGLTEVLFFRDVYSLANPPYFRANTVFKFGYHAWTLLVLSSAVAASLSWTRRHRLTGSARWLAGVPAAFLALMILAGLAYPYQAARQFYGIGSTKLNRLSLDGMAFMRTRAPGDYDAIAFLRRHTPRPEVTIEASGEDYGYFGRVSAFAGVRSPVNWLSHEYGWRIGTQPNRRVAAQRLWNRISATAADVRRIYETPDADTARSLIADLHGRYVYIGALERDTYSQLHISKFHQIGRLIYDAQGVQIFEVESSHRPDSGR